MIPRAVEIVSALYGAWRLARLDPAGAGFFDRSVEGFWKSFFAAVIVAPGYALVLVLWLRDEQFAASALHVFAVHSIIYVIAWIAFPLVMYYLTDNIGRSAEYIGFVVAYNWAQVLQVAAFVPVKWLTSNELMPGLLVVLLNLALYGAILGYQWFIARSMLNVSGLMATGVVALAFIIDLFINSIGIGMIS